MEVGNQRMGGAQRECLRPQSPQNQYQAFQKIHFIFIKYYFISPKSEGGVMVAMKGDRVMGQAWRKHLLTILFCLWEFLQKEGDALRSESAANLGSDPPAVVSGTTVWSQLIRALLIITTSVVLPVPRHRGRGGDRKPCWLFHLNLVLQVKLRVR